MTLAPRVVLVHRRTELAALLERHGTRGQAAFYLRTRGQRIEDLTQRHEATSAAIAAVTSAIPADWRRGTVEREDLSRFLFAPDDIVIAVGQDGLVANVAKYVTDQPVIGIDPEPGRNPGVLVPHAPRDAAALLHAAASARAERLAMVTGIADDGQELTALNEIYVGQPTHQTARYRLRLPSGQDEAQASSGLIVSTGTGATGWCRSAWLERHSTMTLPAADEQRLAWFVREAWPSPATGTVLTEGSLTPGDTLEVTAESDRLVLFGDGIEADAVALTWGQTARLRLAARTLRLIR
jgi:hypothetical protein